MKLRVLFSIILFFTVLVLNAQNYLYIGPYSGSTTATGRISATGTSAELSLSNRAVSSFVESPTNGERWVVYNSGSISDGRLRFWSGGDKVVFTKEGRVGIGTTSPTETLQVNGNAKVGDLNARHHITVTSSIYPEIRFQTPASNEQIRLGVASGISTQYGVGEGDFYVYSGSVNIMPLIVRKNGDVTLNIAGGRVGIGTANPDPDAQLTVAGKIHAREVKVTINAGADFVFSDDYALPALQDVEAFVKENKHLPEVPSAAEMEANGLHLAEMNIKLLQKVEELTLYMIEKDQQLKEQEQRLKALEELVAKLAKK